MVTIIKEPLKGDDIRTMKKDIKKAREERVVEKKAHIPPMPQIPKKTIPTRPNIPAQKENVMQNVTETHKITNAPIVKNLPPQENKPAREHITISSIEVSQKQDTEFTTNNILKENVDKKFNTRELREPQNRNTEPRKAPETIITKPIQNKEFQASNLQKPSEPNQTIRGGTYRENLSPKDPAPIIEEKPKAPTDIKENKKRRFMEDVEAWISSHIKT